MKRILLVALLALIAAVQTPAQSVGGPATVPPWPNTPVTANLLQNPNMETCTLGPCGVGNTTLATWTSTNCPIVADNTHNYNSGGAYSMKIAAGCSGTSAAGVISQPFTYPGGKKLRVLLHYYTDAAYSGYFQANYKNASNGGVFGGGSTGRVGPTVVSLATGIFNAPTPNSAGWVTATREDFTNGTLMHSGDTYTFQIVFPGGSPTTGTINFDAIVLTVDDYPVFNLTTYPNFDGYLWSDLVPDVTHCGGVAYGLPAPFAAEACGRLELSAPWDSTANANLGVGTISYSILEGTNSTCSGGTTIATGNPTSGQFDPAKNIYVIPWTFNGSALPTENTGPVTPYYICPSVTDTYASGPVTSTYASSRFFKVGPTLRASFTNYVGVHNQLNRLGADTMKGLTYETYTATNNVGSVQPNWSNGNLAGCGLATADLCYAQKIMCEGLDLPLATSTPPHTGMILSAPASECVVSYQKENIGVVEDYSDFITNSPIPGSTDALGAAGEAFFDNGGTGLGLLMNAYFGVGYTGASSITTAAIPLYPSAPTGGTPSSTGGNIRDNGTNYLWTKVCPHYWNSGGQAGNRPLLATCSLPVVSTSKLANSTTGSVSLPMPSGLPYLSTCQNERQLGWEIMQQRSTSNTTAPSSDGFAPVADDANSPWTNCGVTTAVIQGSPGDGLDLPVTGIAVASDVSVPAWPTLSITSISISSGTATVTMGASCSFAAGNGIQIEGSSLANLNGLTVIALTSCSGSTWTFSTAVTGTGTGGTVAVLCLTNCGVPTSGHGGATVDLEVQAVQPGNTTQPSQTISLYANNGTLTSTGGTTLTSTAGTANNFCSSTGAEAAFAGESAIVGGVANPIVSVTCPSTMVVTNPVTTGTLIPWSITPTVPTPLTTGSQTAFYWGEGTDPSRNPWNFYMQQAIGSPLGSGATFTVPSQNLMAQQVIMPADLTNVGRAASWMSSLADPAIWAAFGNLFQVGDTVAPFPNAAISGVLRESLDEPSPVAQADAYYQNLSSAGVQSVNPGTENYCVMTDNSTLPILEQVCDVPSTDPYAFGTQPGADLVAIGGQNRNGLIYYSNGNLVQLSTGTTQAAAFLTPQLVDVFNHGANLIGYGARRRRTVLQNFQKVGGSGANSIHGYPYSELRRQEWKSIIGINASGSLAPCPSTWVQNAGTGQDDWYWKYNNTQAYQDFQQSQADCIALADVLGSPTLDSSEPTTIPGYFPPGVGTIITSVTLSATALQACYPGGATPPTYAYENTTYFPYGQLEWMTKRQPITNVPYVFANNKCGSVNNNSSGGVSYTAIWEINASLSVPSIISVVGEGRTITFGSTANCPGATFPHPSRDFCDGPSAGAIAAMGGVAPYTDQDIHIYAMDGGGFVSARSVQIQSGSAASGGTVLH